MGRLLVIVTQDRVDLFESLKQEFAEGEAAGRVEIILDRRRGERRHHIQRHEPERRRGERRHPEKIDDKPRGWWAGYRLPGPPL